jgi:hypothetical protein
MAKAATMTTENTIMDKNVPENLPISRPSNKLIKKRYHKNGK